MLGGYIVEHLIKQGHQVRALARKTSDLSHLKTTGAEIVFGDIEDYKSIKHLAKDCNIAIHAAARVLPGWGQWEDFEKTIINGTANVLKASIENGLKRFVYVSSGSVYGNAGTGRNNKCVDETIGYDLTLNRDTYYDYSKMKAEMLVLDHHRKSNTEVAVVRPCMIYGRRCRLLTDRCYQYAKWVPLVLPGDCKSRTAVVHASDVAECIILAAFSNKAAGQTYNCAPPASEPQCYSDFFNAMTHALGKKDLTLRIPLKLVLAFAAVTEGSARLMHTEKSPFLTISQVRFIRDGMNIDGSKAMKELGWRQRISMADGCSDYVQWRRQRLNGHRKLH